MKRTALYIISLVLFAACEEPLKETPLPKDAGTLELTFAYGGNDDIVSHTFSSSSQAIDVEVRMNTEVGWKVSSDADWCIVDEEQKHRGNGTFSLAVMANDGFVDRDDATVTLTAGDFTKQFRVIQRGNVFIIDKVYELSNRTAGSTDVLVRMPEGTQWHVESPDWVTSSPAETTTADGESRTVVTVTWDENNVESRFGNIGFVEDGTEGAATVNFSLYQFGNEYDTTDDGTILLEAQKAKSVEVKVPVNTFTGMEYPEWVTGEKIDNEDNTVSWHLYFADNPNDTESQRNTELKLLGETDVVLPVITQEYYPVQGLITAKGFEMFAQRFNAGEDVSSWVKDGKVSVVGHVNMKELEDWTPIGTEERPFNLEFDGGFRQISYFKSSAPLFGVCQGATIRSLTFTETCSFTLGTNFIDDVRLASLAGRIVDTEIYDCTSFASIKLDASASVTGRSVYVGGLVGEVDATSIMTDCTAEGEIDLPSTSKCQGGKLYVGGLVGMLFGKVEKSSGRMVISDGMGISSHFLGGVVGYLNPSGTIEECSNGGALAYSSLRNVDGTDKFNDVINMGGIVGYSEGTLKNLENAGNIEINSNVRWQYVGGVAGMIKKSGTVSGLVNSAGKIGSYNKGQQLCVGGLIGCINEIELLDLDFTDVAASKVEISVKPTSSELCVGGLIGRTYGKLTLKSPVCSGVINYDISSEDSNLTAGFGGIVGYAESFEVDGASASGSLSVTPSGSYQNKGQSSYGGIAGVCENGARVVNCTSSYDIKWPKSSSCKQTDGNVCCIGGVVARINEGLAEITNCTNIGALWNWHYNNKTWVKGKNVSCSVTGGIIGLFGGSAGLDPETSNIRITGCTNSGETETARGIGGGIAGVLVNAEIKSCAFTGGFPYMNTYYRNPRIGGICGAVENSVIEGCSVTADMFGMNLNGTGEKSAYVGGISSLLCSGSQIKDCLYFGNITTQSTRTDDRYACIVAFADEDCSVSGCGLGGTVTGTAIATDNFKDYVVGNGAVQATDCYYWNGK